MSAQLRGQWPGHEDAKHDVDGDSDPQGWTYPSRLLLSQLGQSGAEQWLLDSTIMLTHGTHFPNAN
jgi:hypothetical protein